MTINWSRARALDRSKCKTKNQKPNKQKKTTWKESLTAHAAQDFTKEERTYVRHEIILKHCK